MDTKQIEELLQVMEKSGLRRLRIKQEKGFEIELEKDTMISSKSFFLPSSSPEREERRESFSKTKEEGKTINAPLVGTFYAAASPADPPFIKIGDQVEEETIVCIIEAMKVMNEIKAGIKGRVAEALVDNAQPVEFGTPLFRVI